MRFYDSADALHVGYPRIDRHLIPFCATLSEKVVLLLRAHDRH
jgi:hypothetical protein